MTIQNKRLRLKVHLTNIKGLGATKLLESLLPSIENDKKFSFYAY